METVKQGELKKRALLAKQRMKMGYWQRLMDEREQLLRSAGNTQSNARIISEVQRAGVRRDVEIIVNKASAAKDEALYEKVCTILDGDEYSTNPLGRLMDKAEYDGLDDAGKQRYILELSKKYRELKERYFKERIGKSS